MKKFLFSIFALVAMMFAACGNDDDGGSGKISVTGISLDKTYLALEIGESVTVKASIEPSNATDKKVEWSVADNTIASVNNGTVKGVSAGETTITAKSADGNFTATIPVKVVTEKVAVTGIEWYSGIGQKELKIGHTSKYAMIISPGNATDLGVAWTSSNPAVATVKHDRTESSGIVHVELTAVSPGKVTITCQTNDGGFTATTDEITVLEPVLVEAIEVSPEVAKIAVEGVKTLQVSVYPADADNKYYEVSVGDASIATIDENLQVKGLSVGQTEVTFKATDGSGVEGKATIQVLGAMPQTISFDGHNANSTAPYEIYTWHGREMYVKEDLKMTVEPADADLRWIDWNITFANRPEALKYEVEKNNVKFSVGFAENYSGGSFYVHLQPTLDGEQIGDVRVYLQTYPCLFWSYGLSDKTTETFIEILGGQKNYTFNWVATRFQDGINFITYHYEVTRILDAYKQYQIPASEYTLTSSDENKVKVTRLSTGEGYLLERLVWDELVGVTLTYKCGEHTQTYTINLIP